MLAFVLGSSSSDVPDIAGRDQNTELSSEVRFQV